MCHFVPAYILQHIADSEAAPEEARKAAIRTLSVDQDFREQRAQALTSGEDLIAPEDPEVSAAQEPIRAALVGPAATDEPHDADAAALILKRAIYDGKNLASLPGTLARAEGAARTRDRQVNNAFDGVGITVQFFHTVFGRNAINGNGGTPNVTVHHDPDTSNPLGYNNAFWNGQQFAFGDGDGIIFDYFTDSLDVVAHELTHAITQYTAGLNYEKQSGGLNESISDVFAAMVEQWHFSQTAADADWVTGQNLFPVAVKGAALRNIAHPGTAFNDPILGRDRQIAHYSQYTDSLDVHFTSGIPNRAFYLVAIGFGGFSWLKAGKIWYSTLTDSRVKKPGGVLTFKQWADVTVDHASTLYGAAGANIVRNAWVSVGVLA
ncbi:zinc metalloprotease [Phaeosphaeriaceae sp. PMI808]|nr:zinc metalloprotease [Phaeosphaeriaceae sp. PMI808]